MYSPEVIKQIEDMDRKGVPGVAISRATGICRQTLSKLLAKQRQARKQEKIEQAEKMAREGLTGSEIARAIGMCHQTVNRWLAEQRQTEQQDVAEWEPGEQSICELCGRRTAMPCLACYLRGKLQGRTDRRHSDEELPLQHELSENMAVRHKQLHQRKRSGCDLVNVRATDNVRMPMIISTDFCQQIESEAAAEVTVY